MRKLRKCVVLQCKRNLRRPAREFVCVYVCMIATHTTLLRSKWNVFLNVLSPSSLPSMTEFSQNMVENLFNYASSFAVDPRQSPLAPGETYIPSSTLRDWYNTFQRRLAANPNFWKISVVLRMSVVTLGAHARGLLVCPCVCVCIRLFPL